MFTQVFVVISAISPAYASVNQPARSKVSNVSTSASQVTITNLTSVAVSDEISIADSQSKLNKQMHQGHQEGRVDEGPPSILKWGSGKRPFHHTHVVDEKEVNFFFYSNRSGVW